MYEIKIYDSPVQYLYDKIVWIGWLRHRDEISMETAEQLRQDVLKKALEMEQRGCSEKPNTHLNTKESAFIISIYDGYCKWEYGFQPENISSVSIEQIKKVIEEQFKTKMVYAKLIEPYFNRSEKPNSHCKCKQAEFTRDLDQDGDAMCGKCGLKI